MSIDLTPEQQGVLERAIEIGLIRSVDDFINSALGALARNEPVYDPERARLAGTKIRELRRGVRLDLQGMSFRELAHVGHKY
jgi:Arc/MetJ-type ribon-helix-helix transcriptional regulator